MGRSHPDDFEFSLIQRTDDRALTLEKMRAKLASQSLGLMVPPKPKQKYLAAALTQEVTVPAASSWVWKAMMALALLGGNAAWLAQRQEVKIRLAAKTIPTLSGPARILDPNRQALFWTYALYDYARLTSEFGVPAHASVDFAKARANLMELLPKVDAPTRNAIGRYLPKSKRTP